MGEYFDTVMSARENAKLISLSNTDARLEKVERRTMRGDRINNLVKTTGYDPDLGMMIGARSDGSVVKYQLATNDVPAIGRQMEVAKGRGANFGRGDLKPLVN